MQYFSQHFKNFFCFPSIPRHIPLLMWNERAEEYYEIVIKTLILVYSILNEFYWSLFYFSLFGSGYIHNVLSTLLNIVKLDVENNSVVLTLSNGVHINIEINNVDSTFSGVVIMSTLTYTTLFQRWFHVVSRCDVIST